MKKVVFLYIISSIMALNNALTSPSNLKFQQYTLTNGIPQSSVNCILQDSNGFMWFGTNRGIARFDGYEFRVYKFNPNDTVNIYGNKVSSIYEDSKKRLWIGCVGNNGLYLYNKEQDNFTCFYNEPDNPYSLSSSSIRAITEDKEGNLWFGTANGLNKLNPDTSLTKFTRYIHDNNDPTSICGNDINFVYADSRGYLWVGSATKGLDLFNRTKGNFIHFYHDESSFNTISNNYIQCIYETIDSSIWIGLDNGLNKIIVKRPEESSRNNVTFIHYSNNSDIGNIRINSICQDKTGNLWISTDNGLREYKIENKNNLSLLNSYNYDPQDAETLLSDFVLSVYFDSFNAMWVGTSSGLNKSRDSKFLHYKRQANNKLSSNKIEAIFEDEQNNIWLATSKGINMFDRAKNQFSDILPGVKAVLSICQDKYGYLWFGTWHDGLIQYNPKTQKYIRYNENDSTSLSGNNIFSIFEDSKNNLWVAAWGTGVNFFNKESGNFKRYESNDNANSLNSAYASVVFEDSKNNIWIGTEAGLNLLKNKEEGAFYSYLNNVPNKHSKSINCIYESKAGILWVGTMNGLYKTNFPDNDYIMYTTLDGLPDNAVMGILEDNSGNLWVSFMNGFAKISNINKENNTIKVTSFDVVDGLQGEEFVARSCWKTKSGEMLFGGRNGFNIFHPDSIKINTQTPFMVITDFQLFNKNVSVGETINGDTILKKSITQTKEITLSWKNNVFSFHFAALHYIAPMQNQYAYMMEGFDKDWNYTDATRRYASYTNLSHGKYIFKVKASNNDGVWNPVPTQIKLTILPPWWRTTWFKTLVIFAITAVIVFWFKLKTYKLHKQKKMLEERVEYRTRQLKEANQILEESKEELQIQTEQLASINKKLLETNTNLETKTIEVENMAKVVHEADQSKLRFFTNISHEFRTPLTLIMGPLQKLIDVSSHSIEPNVLKFHLNLMYRNTNRLFRLINQLIDFTKIDQGIKKVKPTHNNIAEFLQDVTDIFYPFAEQKQIALKYRHSIDKIDFWFDPDIMEKIVYNLLSNAIKYTPEGGSVSVQLSVNRKQKTENSVQLPVISNQSYDSPLNTDNCLLITVKDTGIGISSQDMEKIFDRFFMAEDTATLKSEGTGIGLAYTKELIKLHGGTISVESEPGEGTTFAIAFLIKEKGGKANSYPEMQEKFNLNYTRTTINTYIESKENQLTKERYISRSDNADNKEKPSLLLIEDNSDMRSFIKTELKDLYKIVLADDGIKGMETAIQEIPDIIISDIMMPGMDGTLVCEKLKLHENTSHIPIILLTAKTGEENIMEGLKVKADDYITKPFNIDILKIKLGNLLETRKLLYEKFSKSVSINPKEYAATSFDQKFISNAIKIVEDNLRNPNFSNAEFVSLIKYSKTFVYNKLKQLTGQSVSEFIRIIRLKKAARLLLESQKNISEIGFEVGFSYHTHFIKYFKQLFGKTPAQFRKGADNE